MSVQAFAVKEDTPLLLRRIREIPNRSQVTTKHPDETGKPMMSHFSVTTTPGHAPEMHDQMEDQYR